MSHRVRSVARLAIAAAMAVCSAVSIADGSARAADDPGTTVDLTVAGHGGVPATGVEAVALNVTETSAAGDGYVTVYPAGQPRPLASNLNFTFGQTVPNMVIVRLGVDGNISIYNSTGTGDVIVDVLGWFPVGGSFHGLNPARLLDTRTAGTGPLGEGGSTDVTVTGRGGVPATGAGAVALNVTVTDPTSNGFVTVWPTGQPRPLASNLNVTPHRTMPNMVIVPVGADGRVSIYNSAGSSDVIVDVLGWFADGTDFQGVNPTRLVDTRVGGATIDGRQAGTGSVGTEALDVPVEGRGGVPATGVGAAVLNVTVTDPTAFGYLTVWPQGASRPLASTLNFGPGDTTPNLVVVPLGPSGVSVYNSSGRSDVVVDLLGWFPVDSSFHGLTPARLVDTRTFPHPDDPIIPSAYAPVALGVPVPTVDAPTAIGNAVAGLTPGRFASVDYSLGPVGLYPGPRLTVTVNSDGSPGSDFEAFWEVSMLNGAVAEQLATTNDLRDALDGADTSIRRPDGSVDAQTTDVGFGNISARQVFSLASASDATITATIDGVLAARGLTAKSITVLHPLGAAPAVVVSVHDAAELRGDLAGLQSELSGNGVLYPGLFLRIELSDGTPIALLETSYRSGEGGQWIAPGYDTLGGPTHG